MQIKNRIFPYPILNREAAFSNFVGKTFSLNYEFEENDNAYVLKNARFETDCDTIKKLILDAKVKICCVIECSYTIFRKSFDLSFGPQDIVLKKKDFSDKVDVSMFAYASSDFVYQPDEVDDDYKGISFEIEKFQILAADDGFNFKVKHEIAEDSLVKSMFTVIRDSNKEKDDDMYYVDYHQNKITITLADNAYSRYELIKSVPDYKEVFFNLLLIPTLIEGLNMCYAESKTTVDLEDVCDVYPWFKSILLGYSKLTGKELTKDELDDITPISLSQMLLRKPLGKSLSCLKKIMDDKASGKGDDENVFN